MDNGGGLAKQCELIKARNPAIKCIVYRNTVIALNQHRHISKLLDDPDYSGYFLKFKEGLSDNCVCKHDSIGVTPSHGKVPLRLAVRHTNT